VLAAPVTVWTVLAATSGRSATMLLGARWLLAVPWGLAANVAVLVAQNFGLLDLTARLGLAARGSGHRSSASC
jgi:hypothetical protein